MVAGSKVARQKSVPKKSLKKILRSIEEQHKKVGVEIMRKNEEVHTSGLTNYGRLGSIRARRSAPVPIVFRAFSAFPYLHRPASSD